jgi:Protein of unknown function (DUF1579)
MATNDSEPTVRAVSRGVEAAGVEPPSPRGAALDALQVFVGRWINEGETITTDGSAGMRIVTSDVYEWAPGRFHIVHSAYGQLAGTDVGGTEIITYDTDTDRFRTYFFDSHGNSSTHDLTVDGNTWVWHGETTCCTAQLSDDGKIQTALHERTDDGGATWQPSMRVTLTKID